VRHLKSTPSAKDIGGGAPTIKMRLDNCVRCTSFGLIVDLATPEPGDCRAHHRTRPAAHSPNSSGGSESRALSHRSVTAAGQHDELRGDLLKFITGATTTRVIPSHSSSTGSTSASAIGCGCFRLKSSACLPATDREYDRFRNHNTIPKGACAASLFHLGPHSLPRQRACPGYPGPCLAAIDPPHVAAA
jgi:hypothetical protein